MSHPPKFWKAALLTGLIAGTLDIIAAIFILGKGNAMGVLKFVASGLLGSEAFKGGYGVAALGLLLHYFIATSFAVFYFLIYPKAKPISARPWIAGVIYGCFVWSVMNLIVVRLSGTPKFPFDFNGFLINILILICMIGLPIAFGAHRYYRK